MGRLLAVVVGLMLLGGCGDDASTSANGTTTTSATDAAVDPDLLTIRPVLRAAAPPCGGVAAGDGEAVIGDPSDEAATSCLVVGPAAVDATRIEEAELVTSGSSDRFDVAVELDAAGSRALDELAQAHLGERLALLLHGRLVSAPMVNSPELAGAVLVAGLTREEAVELVTAVGGDATVPDADPAAAELERASGVCQAFAPSAAEGASATLAIPDTAGSISDLLGDTAIEPWRSLPREHFVARCSYVLPSAAEAPTTICADGDGVVLAQPLQLLVDEDGVSTEDPFADAVPVGCR